MGMNGGVGSECVDTTAAGEDHRNRETSISIGKTCFGNKLLSPVFMYQFGSTAGFGGTGLRAWRQGRTT